MHKTSISTLLTKDRMKALFVINARRVLFDVFLLLLLLLHVKYFQ
jgi:hypothetical protein